MAKKTSTDKPFDLRDSVRQWRSLGGASAIVLTAFLAGCAANTGNPTIENASLNSNGSSVSGANGSNSGNDATYQVRSGDTLYSIAWREKMSYTELARLNNIPEPYTIHVGQRLKLNGNASNAASGAPADTSSPGVQTHAIDDSSASSTPGGSDDSWLLPSSASNSSSGDAGQAQAGSSAVGASNSPLLVGGAASGTNSANGSSTANGASSSTPAVNTAAGSELANKDASGATSAVTGAGGAAAAMNSSSSTSNPASSAASQQVVSASQTPKADPNRKYVPATTISWRWPTTGAVIGKFGDRSDVTAGIDIAGQKGQPVYAAGPGLVVYAGDGVRGYGNLVIIKHNDQYLSAYAHNASLLVKEGNVVVGGQQIATMGNTESSKVELHFEIRQNGKPKDPLLFLPKR